MTVMAYPSDSEPAVMENSRLHTQRVAALRLGLPLAALVILAIVLLWPALTRQMISLPPLPNLPQLTMERPHFSGTDDQNRPFSLSAERAIQQPNRLLLVDLEKLEANMTMADGTPVSGSALRGRFDQGNKRLWLGGNVTVMQPSRKVRFQTNEMFVDFGQRAVWGNRPARLSGDFGTIEGQKFRVYDGGKIMMFTGAVRATLNVADGVNTPGTMLGQ